MFRQFVCAVLAAVVALVARPTQTQAQKALVYCPAGDAAGCGKVVAALASRFEAVDRAFDGANGTVDLATADLAHYAVIVVPSLADGEQATPYALLRANAGRLKMAVTGRVAVFSGAPDQGATNRAAKDALIANLATWAAAGHRAKSGLVGLVAFQDLSENAAARYDWVSAISPVAVSADTELRSWRAVKAMRAGASPLLRDGEREIAYPNMASFGLHIGKGSSARTMVGAVGGDAGQTVLVTHANADEATSGNGMIMSAVAGGDTTWITTDKQDYLPGDTVTFTGGNWAPGDTVRITIHEDPHWVPEHQDRQVVAVAGPDGRFSNRTFVIHVNDFGVTFTATAVGSPSGRTATHTFTDGNILMQWSAGTVGQTVAIQATEYSQPNTTCSGTGSTTTVTLPASPTTVTYTFQGNNIGGNQIGSVRFVAPTTANGKTFKNWSITNGTINLAPGFSVTNANICVTSVTGSNPLTANYESAAAATTTTVNAATATFADASVTLSATVASTSTVNTGTVTFTVKQGATIIGTATTSSTVSGGAASVSYTLPGGTAAGPYTIEATYNAGAGFATSSATGTLTINKAATTTTVTCTGGPFTYDGTPKTPCSASVTGPGGLNQTLTVNYTNNTNAGTATASASYAETANYLGSNDSETFAIGKAATTTTVTCTAGPFTYDGTAKTPCSATVTGPNGLDESLTVSYQNNTGAGTATASASYAETANHLGSSDTETFSIGKATSTVTVTCPADGDAPTYTGSPLTPCTAAATGAGGLNQTLTPTYTNNTNAGTGTASASATFDGDDNHTGNTGSATFSIRKASSTTTVTCTGAPFTYDGTAKTPCSATATGAGGLSAPVTPVNYTNNVNAGTANASATYAGDANHEGSTGSTTFTIDKAPTATTVTCEAGPFVYSGSAHTPCTAKATGPNGLDATLTVTYQNNVNAGTATASASYAETTNYLGSSDSETFAIAKAPTTTTVTCPTDANAPTYTGSPLTPCTAEVTGAGTVTGSATLVYANNVNAGTGTASVTATYAESANHLGSSGTGTFSIKKAPTTTTVTCTAGPFVYNAAAHTPCSANVTGAGGLNQAVTPVDYTGNVNAGTASASANYPGGDNHLPSTGGATFIIEKADQTITWSNPADIVYGTLLGNTQLNATVAGVAGGSAPGALTYTPASGALLDAGNGQTLTVNAAATDNYEPATKSVAINVLKKELTASITASGKTYDGTTAVVGAVGCDVAVKVGADDVDCSASSAAFDDPNAGNRTVTATVALIGTKAPNYFLQATTASVSAAIAKYQQTITWTNPASIAYPTTLSATQLNAQAVGVSGGTPPGALTYTPASGTVLLAGSHTLQVGAAATDNYLAATQSVSITVTNDAPVVNTITVDPATGVFPKGSATAKLTVNFTDPGVASDAYTAKLTLTSALGTVVLSSATTPSAVVLTSYNGSAGVFTIALGSLPVGVYTATVEVTDRFNSTGSKAYDGYLVVYDPSAGFVTGGGWITSPVGACKLNPACETLTGKANFGFVAKYQKGQQTPSGNTEFQFHAGNLNFKSSSYQWLVVAGARAQFKGEGMVNGVAGFSFILTGIDGQENGGGGIDKFRIKITKDGAVVYDNQMDADDNAALTTTLSGGSIQIHSK